MRPVLCGKWIIRGIKAENLTVTKVLALKSSQLKFSGLSERKGNMFFVVKHEVTNPWKSLVNQTSQLSLLKRKLFYCNSCQKLGTT